MFEAVDGRLARNSLLLEATILRQLGISASFHASSFSDATQKEISINAFSIGLSG